MPKLTDSQLVVLSAAAQRKGEEVFPLPKSLKHNKGAAAKVLKSLLKHKLVAEQPTTRAEEAWREAKDGTRLTLVITETGLRAIGVEQDQESAAKAETRSRATQYSGRGAKAKTASKVESAGRKDGIRAGTKQALLIDLLKRKGGATIAEAVKATGWQAHSVRGAMSGALKKKLGLTVTSNVIEGRGRVYQIPAR